MADSTSVPEGHSLICSNIPLIPSILMMLLATIILVSGYPYVFQNIPRPSLICNVVEIYLETDNTSDICNVSVLETHRTYLHRICHTDDEELFTIYVYSSKQR